MEQEKRGRKKIIISEETIHQVLEYRELGLSYKSIKNALLFYFDRNLSIYKIQEIVKNNLQRIDIII